MGRKWLAALMAAASIVPATAFAQDRGERGGGDRGAARAERMQQRQAERGTNSGGGWQQRQPQVQQQPQRQADRSNAGGGWQQPGGGAPRDRAVQDSNPGQWQQQRRDTRQAFEAERQRDRQALQSGQVTREAFRADRTRDLADYRRDRQQDRPAFASNPQVSRERGVAVQRSWDRSGADRNDQRRWDNDRREWNDQRRWAGDRGGWNGNRGWGDRGGGSDRGGWDRNWRNNARYDWNRWRVTNRAAFHLPRYYAPYGWNSGYRRFGIGAMLSNVLFAQNYWISDPWAYRLPDADGSYRWVRYYNDALLVDMYSGEVVDVINDIFW